MNYVMFFTKYKQKNKILQVKDLLFHAFFPFVLNHKHSCRIMNTYTYAFMYINFDISFNYVFIPNPK